MDEINRAPAPRRRGRPRTPNPRRKQNTIHVTLTDEERATILAAARFLGRDHSVCTREWAVQAASRLTHPTESTGAG